MKVLALDYGAARTGVAISDADRDARAPARRRRARRERGRAAASSPSSSPRRAPSAIVVGLPLTLRGEHGAQADETAQFVEALRAAVDVPVESFDERFTTALAAAGPSSRAPEDARAAAHLLESYLAWTSRA